jgi:hypothetical protein
MRTKTVEQIKEKKTINHEIIIHFSPLFRKQVRGLFQTLLDRTPGKAGIHRSK